MSKSEAMIELADDIARQINPESIGLISSQATAICNICNGPASTFTDALSAKEYSISGMCQVCQDDFFDNTPDFGPSTVDPNDTIQSVFGDYTEEEINAAYDEYDADQKASR